MKLRVGGTTYDGRVVDLRHRAIDGSAIVAAIREESSNPVVRAPDPSTVYTYCGRVHAEMGLRIRTALAAAARSRGHETRYDEAITDLRQRLRERDTAEPSLPPVREDVPDGDIAELRESTAEARGRLQAREALEAETDSVEQTVRESTTTLAERETERTAARESRRQRREAARTYRDRLVERRRLADRLANRRRDARRELVKRLAARYRTALDAVPGPTPPDPFEVPPVPAALAVLRVARTEAPVVLEVDRFRHPTAAADWLGAPVVRC